MNTASGDDEQALGCRLGQSFAIGGLEDDVVEAIGIGQKLLADSRRIGRRHLERRGQDRGRDLRHDGGAKSHRATRRRLGARAVDHIGLGRGQCGNEHRRQQLGRSRCRRYLHPGRHQLHRLRTGIGQNGFGDRALQGPYVEWPLHPHQLHRAIEARNVGPQANCRWTFDGVQYPKDVEDLSPPMGGVREDMDLRLGVGDEFSISPHDQVRLVGHSYDSSFCDSPYSDQMTRLVALALPGGPAYVEAIKRVWADGDAIAPIDLRLPSAERDQVISVLQPSAIIEADGEPRSIPGGVPLERGDAAVVATSGTSGRPKAVIHTHDSIKASAEATSSALTVDPTSDKWLACLPLAHIGGLAVVLRSLVTGTPVEVHAHFDQRLVMAAADQGATLVSLVTRALNQIPASVFRTILIGGAAPPPDRPSNVVATYGMTETGSGVVYDRQPLDGVEIDIDNGGEVRLRGPMLFRAYRHDPEPCTADGWFPTGDLGRWDEDGCLRIDGRKGDVIVTGGEKVWPARIEAVLAQRPDVAQVALIGRPDPDWGHRVVAIVVPTEVTAPPSLDDLRSTTKEAFPPWCAPRELELRTKIPRTSSGKIRRDQLA